MNSKIQEKVAIGNRLEQFIKHRKVSQDELAIKCNLSRQTINNIINGKTNTSSEFLANMAFSYNDLNIHWLLTGRGKMLVEHDNNKAFDSRLDYPHQSLIEIIDEKDNTIVALKEVINSKDAIIKSQQEVIQLHKTIK